MSEGVHASRGQGRSFGRRLNQNCQHSALLVGFVEETTASAIGHVKEDVICEVGGGATASSLVQHTAGQEVGRLGQITRYDDLFLGVLNSGDVLERHRRKQQRAHIGSDRCCRGNGTAGACTGLSDVVQIGDVDVQERDGTRPSHGDVLGGEDDFGLVVDGLDDDLDDLPRDHWQIRVPGRGSSKVTVIVHRDDDLGVLIVALERCEEDSGDESVADRHQCT